MAWTHARTEKLRELWAADQSAAQIAAELRGVSRSAVIGKVHRLGLPSREPRKNPIISRKARRGDKNNGGGLAWKLKQFGRKALKRPADPKPAKLLPITEYQGAPSLSLSLIDLELFQCRWITSGERDQSLFCGHPSRLPRGYCEAHHALAYVQSDTQPRRQKPDYHLYRRAA